MAQEMLDPRVKQYWDPNATIGRNLKKQLSLKKTRLAWDIYLFYKPGQTLNSPNLWAHQMSMEKGKHLIRGKKLEVFLEQAMQSLN